jgi:hypothetical protein
MKFKAEVQEIILHLVVEVSKDLLMWMDLGGTRVSEARIDDTSAERAHKIFTSLEVIEDIDGRSIEYNGHFGPYVHFCCEQGKEEAVSKAVIAIIKSCERRMLRSRAHKAKVRLTSGIPATRENT